MKNLKKIAVITLAMSMVAGSSFSAFATGSQGSSTGTGLVEGTVNKDVFSVELPTDVTNDTDYKFILDPEGLIAATSATKYPNATFENGSTMFFANPSDEYTNTSNPKKITNKSAIDVDVTLTATVNVGTDVNVRINPDSAFTDDTSASMYMALTDGDATDPKVAPANESGVAVLTTSIGAAPDGSYEVVYDGTTSEYKYQLKSSVNTGFEEFSFSLTGASNAKGDWSQLANITPTVEVVWAVVPHSDNILVTDGTNDVVIYHGEATPPTEVTVTPVGNAGTNKTPVVMQNGAQVVIDATTVTVKASWLNAMKTAAAAYGTGTYKVTIGTQDYTFTIN